MGEVFAGRYELVDPIGRGGVGAVWRAWDHRRRRYVAAKVLQQSDAHTLIRFVREQAVRIDHPHVLAPASWAADDDKVLFTMDLVGGGSLAHLIGDYGPLPPAFVCTLLDQLLAGLAAVHAEGVVHRDIKPANVLLEATGTSRPHLRLSDFGISMRKGEPRITDTNYVVGTPGYFAPEQIAGAEPDFPADLFAVGLVALYLLEGAKPDAKALVEHFEAHGTPSAPKNIPEPMWQVIAGLLQPDPEKRFRTATGARKALTHAADMLPEPCPDDEVVEVFDQIGPLPEGFGPQGPLRTAPRHAPGVPGAPAAPPPALPSAGSGLVPPPPLGAPSIGAGTGGGTGPAHGGSTGSAHGTGTGAAHGAVHGAVHGAGEASATGSAVGPASGASVVPPPPSYGPRVPDASSFTGTGATGSGPAGTGTTGTGSTGTGPAETGPAGGAGGPEADADGTGAGATGKGTGAGAGGPRPGAGPGTGTGTGAGAGMGLASGVPEAGSTGAERTGAGAAGARATGADGTGTGAPGTGVPPAAGAPSATPLPGEPSSGTGPAPGTSGPLYGASEHPSSATGVPRGPSPTPPAHSSPGAPGGLPSTAEPGAGTGSAAGTEKDAGADLFGAGYFAAYKDSTEATAPAQRETSPTRAYTGQHPYGPAGLQGPAEPSGYAPGPAPEPVAAGGSGARLPDEVHDAGVHEIVPPTGEQWPSAEPGGRAARRRARQRQRRPGPPPKWTAVLVCAALFCYAVAFWALLQT